MRLKLRQWLCGLHGHDYLRRFERTRLSLKCVNCAHESPGWGDLGHRAHELKRRREAGSFTRSTQRLAA